MKAKNIATILLLVFAGIMWCKQPVAAKERQELVLWSYYETQAQRTALDNMVRDFNQSQNSWHLSWKYVTMTGFIRKLSSAYTENDLPDMAILDNPDMPVMIRLGMFEDITELAEKCGILSEYYPSIVRTVQYEDRIYGMPFNCNNTALIYNKEILEQAGVEAPSTWEELRTAARVLTNDKCQGFSICAMQGEQGAFQILPWILSAGEEPDCLGGRGTEEAYEFFRNLIWDGSLSENCINLTQTDLGQEFVEGKIAIMQNGPWILPMLDDAGVDYGIVPIPGEEKRRAVLGGENIGILKGKNREGSLAFLEFCMSGDKMLEFCETAGVLPARKDLAKEYVKKEEKMKVFEEQMETAVTRSEIPRWSSVSEKLTEGMFQTVTGEKTPKESAREIYGK